MKNLELVTSHQGGEILPTVLCVEMYTVSCKSTDNIMLEWVKSHFIYLLFLNLKTPYLSDISLKVLVRIIWQYRLYYNISTYLN